MTSKHQVHNLIILDESGSMSSIKKNVMQGFNEIVQTVKGIEKEYPEQAHFISMGSFNSLGNKLLHFIDPAVKLNEINENSYQPNAGTPLYDALGFSINKLKQYLSTQTDYNVLVTIFTDGEENASKEFSGTSIKQMIDELKLNHWTFTYIGADHDVESFAANISIHNTIMFQKNEEDINRTFLRERRARHIFSEKMKMKENLTDDFYRDSDLLDDTNPKV